MKKILLLLLSLTVAFGSFVGCNSTKPNKGDSSKESVETNSETSEKQENVYVITFKQEGQNDVVKEVKEGKALTDIPMPVQKTGYTTVWSVTDFSSVTQDLTVNAVTTANEYTITYDANGGSVTSATQKVTYDQAPAAFATPTREGYEFVCWTYEGKAVQAADVWKIAGDVTLVASWKAIAKYVVSFVQDGYEPVEIEVLEGGTLASEDIPEPQDKTGYDVVWETKDLTNITANVTVNAIATAKKYTVTYDANGGSVTPATQEVTYDQAPAAFAEPTRESYKFQGWTYEGKAVTATDVWKIASDVTLVASWVEIEKRTVTFVQDGYESIVIEVLDGGTLATEDIPATQNKTGYEVVWETKDLTNITENIIVNAIATAKRYTVTYDANGGSVTPATQEVTYDKAPATFAEPTREGYKFVCWKYDGKAVQATDVWKIADNVTLVAEWVALKKYTVTFVQDGYEPVKIEVLEGGSIAQENVPTTQAKTGYEVVWEVKDLTNITANVTVNAIATAKKYTVTYDANGGTVTPATQEVTYDQAPASFATPTREGYEFICWTYNGEAISADSVWTVADNATLTAKWAKIYTITLNASGGKFTDGTSEKTVTVVEGKAYSLPTALTMSGYSFGGWKYGSTKVAANGTWTIDGENIVLSAEWTEDGWTKNY